MNRIPQVAPVTQIQKQPSEVFALLESGPVVLASHSKAAAVLVSVEEWDSIADKLAERRFTQKEVEAIINSYRQRAADEPTISHEELKAKVAERAHVANPL